MPEEIELKLALPRSALAALRRHPLVAAAEKLGNAVTLDNTYYDTPKLQLKARKVDISPFGKILHKHKKLWHGKKAL